VSEKVSLCLFPGKLKTTIFSCVAFQLRCHGNSHSIFYSKRFSIAKLDQPFEIETGASGM